eukprot:1673552-Prymnesium_polylepis.1
MTAGSDSVPTGRLLGQCNFAYDRGRQHASSTAERETALYQLAQVTTKLLKAQSMAQREANACCGKHSGGDFCVGVPGCVV